MFLCGVFFSQIMHPAAVLVTGKKKHRTFPLCHSPFSHTSLICKRWLLFDCVLLVPARSNDTLLPKIMAQLLYWKHNTIYATNHQSFSAVPSQISSLWVVKHWQINLPIPILNCLSIMYNKMTLFPFRLETLGQYKLFNSTLRTLRI